MYFYKKEAEKIISSNPHLKNEIFEYDISTIASYFEGFFQFAAEHLKTIGKEIGVENTLIVFKNNTTVNAEAGKGYILINAGTIVRMEDFSKRLAMRLPLLKKLKTELDVPIDFFIFQFNLLYVFYHELGHIIQNPFDSINSLNENPYENIEYDEFKHILEIDADWYAANRISHHIIHKWNSTPTQNQSNEFLGELINTSIAGVYFFQKKMFIDKIPKIYLNEQSHPHPALRLFIILAMVKDRLSSISEKADHLLGANLFDFLIKVDPQADNFFKEYQIMRPEINKYLGDVLEKSQSYKILVRNKFKR